MKIHMTEEKCYTFKLGGKVIDGMRAVSRWNGMTELRGADGQTLIVAFENGGIAETLTSMFGDELVRTADIISGSPELLALLLEAESKPPTTGGVVVNVSMPGQDKVTARDIGAAVGRQIKRAANRKP